ncbi:MAG: FAD/NAD(P)-binding protein [Rudaea sp.]|uniref:FAD/NAD(P)-binding protein n=1 Tax=unclassified Rudaea TaxID=2627037 RepID=UPI0010F5BF3E|nr:MULTISPECIES: FAD/NAD(P)-binding protein [unclassified Rudaea]MBN8886591.1 FAD/NAD(P)-binding protein [Rudaea sp.]
MQRLIVIGGGAAGSAVVGEFLRRGQPGDFDLTWLVGRQAPGRGVAYSTTAEHHLLNVRAANMGLFADDAGAFIAYAQTQGWPVKGLDFVPRAWYGDYLEAVLAREITGARERGLAMRVLSVDAASVRGDDANGYSVRTADGEELVADGVVLAIGALPSVALAEVSESARASHAYTADPWHWPLPRKAPERVVVLGTGLTAVDALQSAARLWPNAQLTAISRHGRLPRSHNAAPGQPYEQQASLIEALRAKPNVAHWLREIRAAIQDEDVEWRSVVDGLRSETQNLWRMLDAHERARFLRHLRWLWESARHRLPQQTTNELARLRTQGRLKVLAAHIRSIDTHASERGQLEVRVQPRGAEGVRSFAADLVIQATGFNISVKATDHPLIRQMESEGIAHPDELDLGLATDAEGRLLRADGTPAHGLRCLGTLLRGSIWECSGLPEIRSLAKAIARDMPGELRQAAASAPARANRPRISSLASAVA